MLVLLYQDFLDGASKSWIGPTPTWLYIKLNLEDWWKIENVIHFLYINGSFIIIISSSSIMLKMWVLSTVLL